MMNKKVAILIDLDKEKFYENLFVVDSIVRELTVHGKVDFLMLFTEEESKKNEELFSILKTISGKIKNFYIKGKKEHKKFMKEVVEEKASIILVGGYDDFKATMKYHNGNDVTIMTSPSGPFLKEAWNIKKMKEVVYDIARDLPETKGTKYIVTINAGLNIAMEAMLKFGNT